MENKYYKVIAIGDNIIDKYEKDGHSKAGGNALNFAVYSKMLNASSSYLGVFGTDDNATLIKNIIDGLDISKSKTIDGENGYVSIEIKNGERDFINGNRGGVGQNLSLDDSDLEYIKNFDIVNTNIISHFNVEREIKKIHVVNQNIAFDFSIRFEDTELSKYAPFIKHALLSTRHISKYQTANLLKDISKKFDNIEFIISTRAEEGSVILNNNKIYYADAYKDIDYKDSLGAGDAYFSSFLYNYYSKNIGIENAMLEASKFAAYICTIDGAF